jgi:hypothetical protein
MYVDVPKAMGRLKELAVEEVVLKNNLTAMLRDLAGEAERSPDDKVIAARLNACRSAVEVQTKRVENLNNACLFFQAYALVPDPMVSF